MPTFQYVNLTKDVRWAGAGETVSCMGAVSVVVQFNRAARRDFRYRVVPGDDNVVYSDAEAGRNGDLRAPAAAGVGQTDDQGVARFDVRLSAAGGDVFTIEAWKTSFKKEKEKSTVVLTTARRLFYTFAAMPHTPAINHGELQQAHMNPSEKRYIQLVRDGGALALADAPVFYSELESVTALRAELGALGWTAGARAPIGFTICLVHAIQREEVKIIQATVQCQVPDLTDAAFAGCTVNVVTGTLMQNPAKPAKYWYYRATYEYTGADGRPQRATMATAMVTAAGGGTSVDIAFSAADLAAARRASGGPTTLDVRVRLHFILAKGMSGETFPDYKLIVLATERNGTAFSDHHVKVAIIHEIGHMIGMVHGGTGRRLDKPDPDTYYTGRGHDGPHCSAGASYTAPAHEGDPHVWTGNQTCVMYGAAMRDIHSGPYSPTTYCAGCSAVVRKIDLGRVG